MPSSPQIDENMDLRDALHRVLQRHGYDLTPTVQGAAWAFIQDVIDVATPFVDALTEEKVEALVDEVDTPELSEGAQDILSEKTLPDVLEDFQATEPGEACGLSEDVLREALEDVAMDASMLIPADFPVKTLLKELDTRARLKPGLAKAYVDAIAKDEDGAVLGELVENFAGKVVKKIAEAL